MFVGHNEVSRREIKGNFKRFKYLCNGLLSYVYCESKEGFRSLFTQWVEMSKSQWYKDSTGKPMYTYEIVDADGFPMSLENIIMDAPAGTKGHHFKMLIGGYIQ